MKTRNQLNSKTADHSNHATPDLPNSGPSSELHAFRDPQSPSTPKLRDRRSSSIMETKPQPASALTTNASTHPNKANSGPSPSPPAGAKRPSTGPTRILPRRSCGRPGNSLLASGTGTSASNNNSISSNPSNCTSNSSTNNKTSSNSSAKLDQTGSKKVNSSQLETSDELSSLLASNSSPNSEGPDGPNTLKTASLRNYSRDIPTTPNIMLPKITAAHDNQTQSCNNKTKLVRISLPETQNSDGSSSCNPIAQGGSDSAEKDRYMVTTNGLKRVDCSNSGSTNGSNSSFGDGDGDGDGCEDALNLTSKPNQSGKTFNILVGVTGSVATIKLIELVQKIRAMFPRPYTTRPHETPAEARVALKIVMTQHSQHFTPKSQLVESLNDSSISIYDDNDEWSAWSKMNDPVLHIELRKWADLFLIAPLDANSMGKIANGICDNLLTCIVRAWDTSKPLIYCPAMNVHMYNHPITKEQLCKLQSFGYLRVDSIEKRLACGDVGIGAMATVETISNKVVETLFNPASRKTSLSKPLLNQQPTYPIISTSGNQGGRNSSSSIGDQILNRFRSNNQITIHAVPDSNSRSSQQNLISSARNLLIQRSRTELNGSVDLSIEGDSRSQPQSQTRPRMGGVTSLQNLKAIGMEGDSAHLHGETTNIADDEEMVSDFDPSNLLEQSMVTDETNAIDLELRVNQERNLDRSSSFFNGTPASAPASGNINTKINGMSPLFNTSKFLALCHNKERGCFTCKICKHDYKNRKSMARHLKEQHVQGNIYHCGVCGVSYKRREKLIKHNRERHLMGHNSLGQ